MENQFQSTSMQFLILEQVQFFQVNENDDSLLQWELVDVVDTEEEEEKEREESHDFDSWDSSPIDVKIEGIRHLLIHPNASLEDQNQHHDDDGDDADGYHDDDDEDEDDEDGYGLDDELVPWNVSNKFGRERMRKLGKRAFSKMHTSKKSPYLFVRPGCVRGKHGLGLKHSNGNISKRRKRHGFLFKVDIERVYDFGESRVFVLLHQEDGVLKVKYGEAKVERGMAERHDSR
ncbi:hypothetical protein RJT34_31859 [Clitoria ternatea]|uniref:Uncharacterized protein n=1 Tax=Clitoria ternatea TaxID=43366 RepID=A0AAN9EWM1_CLITE